MVDPSNKIRVWQGTIRIYSDSHGRRCRWAQNVQEHEQVFSTARISFGHQGRKAAMEDCNGELSS